MKYSFDNVSLMRDGKRWFPIMGEIHYSRVPCQYWSESLEKMKAGGVDIVSAYVIWIHHEEIEGEYDWSGNKDLHKFMETAKKCGMKVLLRIGPWCHGEVRNGGFPDWLLHKDYEPRTNDERYFEVAEKWYKKIYEQVSEFITKPESDHDNTIVGVQIENEYGHCGGLYEKESGEFHMKKLQEIARKTGFDVPIYTATGWGGAWTGDMIPVMGGYCDAPWDQRVTEIEPSGNYTFTHERNDHNIGSDHGFGYGITFDMEKFPYLTAELGGGLQVTSHRRTIATAKDIAAVATVKLGSGVNLLGFYMYHGGTNPEGKLTTLQESRETGYLNDLPVKSYDFRAPVREFGQVSDTLRELKLLATFVKDFGEELCELPAKIPENNPLSPNDLNNLRYSFRSDGKKGYFFVNNYVRHQTLAEHSGVSLTSPDGKTVLPTVDIKNGEFFFFPFNMEYGDTKVKTATATPYMKLQDIFVFYKRENDEKTSCFFDLDVQSVEKKAKFLVLSRKDALNAWKTADSRLVITDDDAYVIQNGGKDEIIGRTDAEFYVYPDFEKAPAGWKKTGTVNKNAAKDLPAVEFAKYERAEKTEKPCGKICFEKCGKKTDEKGNEVSVFKFALTTSEIKGEISDIFAKIDYVGESAKMYAKVGGERKLILDNFWLGEDYPWEIGLKRFVGSNVELSSIELEIVPLKKDAEIYIEKWPEISGESRVELKTVGYEAEWKFEI